MRCASSCPRSSSSASRPHRRARRSVRRVALLAALVLAGIGVAGTLALGSGPRNAYVVHRLVSDERTRAPLADRRLVNAWGLVASGTGPWWTGNEGSSTSNLYSGGGGQQPLTREGPRGPAGGALLRRQPAGGGGRG